MVKHNPFLGSNEPLEIFQDEFFENTTMPMPSHAPMPSVSRPNRRPLTSADSNAIFNPSNISFNGYSLFKQRPASSSQTPLATSTGNKLNAVAMAPPSTRWHTTDSLQKKPMLSNFKTAHKTSLKKGNKNYASDAALDSGKENVQPQLYQAPSVNFPVDSSYQKPNGKRPLMEAAPIKDSRATKKTKIEPKTEPQSPRGIPHLDYKPPIYDDGNKPPHSYSVLIAMAIVRSPNRRLTLSQIYKWISDHYSFYGPNENGWQNSIRHNLSLQKHFLKIERPKEDPGKGNYWMIEEGQEANLLREKSTRKSASASENLPVMSTRLEPSRPASTPMQEPTLPPPVPVNQTAHPPLPTSQATMSIPVDLSSDATIPVSDNIGPEDVADKADNDASFDFYSPLPTAMHSSPPVSRHMDPRSNTPPPMSRNPVSSVSRSHRRKVASMDDSGYISSLESSAIRPPQRILLTSEADRPRNKSTGCAEEAIARIRNSSPFSPTKTRYHSVIPPASSSPIRPAYEKQMLPPLTPAVKLQPPVCPPPSASPNTNLRAHRNQIQHMLDSPLRRVTDVTDDVTMWSPAFNLDDNVYHTTFGCNVLHEADFGMADMTGFETNSLAYGSMSSAETGSPVKQSTKRGRLERTASASALCDITSSVTKKPIASAALKAPEQFVPYESPSKMLEGLDSPTKMFQQSPVRNTPLSRYTDFLNIPTQGDWATSLMDPSGFTIDKVEDGTEPLKLDIFKGFQRIGARPHGDNGENSNSALGSNKPALGRSYSTNF
ncbi:hypothetical protein F66182_9715 [Fusarium sp. NRRL 66182]|nr:hypothetical protein F66182_9715 [Fusarium sp. NRRL 66182]